MQAYVYAAFVARAHIADEAGDTALAASWAHKALLLKERFNEAFWLPDRGWFAVGLDRDKRPIDALASNMGHCLWTGIVDPDKAGSVAAHLLSPAMFTGWGVRTLASTMGAYNPMSYHNGSVWPHDNALLAAGLMRYGYVEQAQRVAVAILDAAVALGGRLPELFAGFDRGSTPPRCRTRRPALPRLGRRHSRAADPHPLTGGSLDGARADLVRAGLAAAVRRAAHRAPAHGGPTRHLTAAGSSGEIVGLPEDVQVLAAPRAPLTAAGTLRAAPRRGPGGR